MTPDAIPPLLMIAAVTLKDGTNTDAFNDFYEKTYIPDLLQVGDSVESVVRYQAMEKSGDGGFLDAQYVTVYCLGAGASMDDVERSVLAPAHKAAFEEFKKWKMESFAYFDRAYYQLPQSAAALEDWHSLHDLLHGRSVLTMDIVDEPGSPSQGVSCLRYRLATPGGIVEPPLEQRRYVRFSRSDKGSLVFQCMSRLYGVSAVGRG